MIRVKLQPQAYKVKNSWLMFCTCQSGSYAANGIESIHGTIGDRLIIRAHKFQVLC